jgi:hypothetical protein
VASFALLALLAPRGVLFWLIPFVGLLAWLATYGFGKALRTLIEALSRLDNSGKDD